MANYRKAKIINKSTVHYHHEFYRMRLLGPAPNIPRMVSMLWASFALRSAPCK
jgi:hypothetical protein